MPRAGASTDMELPIYDVPNDPPLRSEETLGSKAKFWFRRGEEEWLFKRARDGTGEDWAELIAAHCAGWLGLPHAHYELAACNGQHGVVSRKLYGAGANLVFGNQLLGEQDPGYTVSLDSRFLRTPRHTIQAVAHALRQDIGLPEGWMPPGGVTSALEVFGGYLLLDAWVANTDRHHLNWGAIESSAGPRRPRTLAPTFDHAASLGAGLTERERERRLATRNEHDTVAAYVRRAQVRSAFFRDPRDRRPLAPLDAFLDWCREVPGARRWLAPLAALTDDTVTVLIERLPAGRVSGPARRFAAEMLRCNQRRILEVERP